LTGDMRAGPMRTLDSRTPGRMKMWEANMVVIGLDLGATKLAGALFDRDGRILERGGGLLEGRDGDEVGRLIVERLAALRRSAADLGRPGGR
jgi:predicted NBD/HSP70 family sugar kinase